MIESGVPMGRINQNFEPYIKNRHEKKEKKDQYTDNKYNNRIMRAGP